MQVSVLGLGYVGSVTAACLARAGHHVIGVDTNPEKVAMINAGQAPVGEPGLPEFIGSARACGRLRATTSCSEAIATAEVALICVGTPSKRSGQLDTTALLHVAVEIGNAIRGRRAPLTVIVRSTVLPGTIELLFEPALRRAVGDELGVELHVGVNPEFLREGSSLYDFEHPPFTLIGCQHDSTAELVRSLYRGVNAPVVQTDLRTAQMVKYACNAFHALKVCFANEVAEICDALGANGEQVMDIVRMDKKLNISEAYLRPGFAFGGSCLPKDLRALVYAARAADYHPLLLAAVLPSNEQVLRAGITQILELGRRHVGVVGLAFKPDTDDLREAPLVTLVETLIGKGLDVRILDSNVALARLMGANRRYIEKQLPHVASLLCGDVESLVCHAEVLVIGNLGADAERVLKVARPEQLVVDLTRTVPTRQRGSHAPFLGHDVANLAAFASGSPG